MATNQLILTLQNFLDCILSVYSKSCLHCIGASRGVPCQTSKDGMLCGVWNWNFDVCTHTTLHPLILLHIFEISPAEYIF